jgi:hypothetical protein
MRIEHADPADGPGQARRPLSATDDPGMAVNDRAKAADGNALPNSSHAHYGSALLTERTTAYRGVVATAYRHGDNDGVAADLRRAETLRALSGDAPDDPRNHSNPKTGRIDASWSAYDRAIAAAREHAGGDLGPGSIKMYDHNPQTGEGTGTLIGEQTADRLRGWRIDGQDGHVNWWDWTGGKKGAGGAYGHDWFPEDSSAPGSRYIGWAPWQDNDGNLLEGN